MKEQPKELNACPFCGNLPQIENFCDPPYAPGWVECQHKGCGLRGISLTLEAWNHRAPAPGVLLSDGERLTDALKLCARFGSGFIEDTHCGAPGVPGCGKTGLPIQDFVEQVLEDHAARLANAAPDSWQGIETAPMNTTILVFWTAGAHKCIGTAYRTTFGWTLANDGDSGSVDPTHWQPLPSPPKANP